MIPAYLSAIPTKLNNRDNVFSVTNAYLGLAKNFKYYLPTKRLYLSA